MQAGSVLRRYVRALIVSLALLAASVPLAAVLTVALMPAWSWVETRFGIESVGHSGPASWCYEVMYAGCVIAIGSGLFWSHRRSKRPGAPDVPVP